MDIAESILYFNWDRMNSFFYGNPFSKNYMVFPYLASKMNSCISFDDSTFAVAKADKASTARVVLGNLLKDVANVYTYEASFYGTIKNV